MESSEGMDKNVICAGCCSKIDIRNLGRVFTATPLSVLFLAGPKPASMHFHCWISAVNALAQWVKEGVFYYQGDNFLICNVPDGETVENIMCGRKSYLSSTEVLAVGKVIVGDMLYMRHGGGRGLKVGVAKVTAIEDDGPNRIFSLDSLFGARPGQD